MSKQEIAVVLTATDSGLTSTIGKATQGLKMFQRGVSEWNQEAAKLDGGLSSLAGKFSALFGGISTVAFAKSVFDAGLIVDRLDRSFIAITGSSNNAQREMDFVKQTANDLGLEFVTVAESYKKLMAASKGTSLEGTGTREIFLGIAEASAVLNLSADQTQGALTAIEQMMSKGNVQAEELRGQLGERLPGAFGMAAKAMGVTTQELDKLLKNGQVTAADMLPKLAKVLRDEYGKAALDAGNSATAGVNRFKNAWLEFRIIIARSGFMDVATGKIRDLTAALNDPKVQKSVAELTTKFVDMAEAAFQFGVNHGEALLKITGGLVAMSALSRSAHLLTGIWAGLNAAMLVTTGLQLIPYLTQLRTSLDMAKIAALGVAGALGAAAGGTLAYLAGLNIGEQIYKATDAAEVALAKLRHDLDLTAAKFQQFANFTPEKQESLFAKSERDLEGYKQKLEGAFRYQSAVVSSLYAASRETNFWGQQTEEAKRAQVEYVAAKTRLGEIEKAMNEYGGAAAKVHQQTEAAARKSATGEKTAKLASLEEMQKAYQKYVETISRLQDQIGGKERDLTARLREMSQSGMSDVAAWKDRKKEAEEYVAAAKKAQEAANTALQAGDQDAAAKSFKLAEEYAQRAEKEYGKLTGEVKNGDQVFMTSQETLKVAMAGTKKAGELEIEIIKQEKKAASEAVDALNKSAGWKLGDAFTDAGQKLKLISDQGVKFNENWQATFVAMGKDAAKEIDGIDKMLSDMAAKKRGITFHVATTSIEDTPTEDPPEARALGGVIHHLARGGRLPGYGGGDRVRALLEPGEFVVRKEAVTKYGLNYLYSLNSMRLNDFSIIRARIGGMIGSATTGYQRLQQGGVAMAKEPTETINVNLNLPTPGRPVPMQMTRQNANEFLRQLEAIHRMSG